MMTEDREDMDEVRIFECDLPDDDQADRLSPVIKDEEVSQRTSSSSFSPSHYPACHPTGKENPHSYLLLSIRFFSRRSLLSVFDFSLLSPDGQRRSNDRFVRSRRMCTAKEKRMSSCMRGRTRNVTNWKLTAPERRGKNKTRFRLRDKQHSDQFASL